MDDLQSGEELYVQPWEDLLADEHAFWNKLINDSNLPPLIFSNADATGLPEPAELARLINADPLLAGRVLAVANSAAMGRAKEVSDLELAVVYLGANVVQTIVAAYRVEQVFQPGGVGDPDYLRFIQSWSAASAVIACNVTAAIDRRQAPEAGTAALLSRVGSLLFVYLDHPPGPDYLRIRNDANRLKLETAAWGITGPVLSGRLARRWGLPEGLCRLLETSWEPEVTELEPGNERQLQVVVATSVVLGSNAVMSERFDAGVVLDRNSTAVLRANLDRFKLRDRFVDICSSRTVQRELEMVRHRSTRG